MVLSSSGAHVERHQPREATAFRGGWRMVGFSHTDKGSSTAVMFLPRSRRSTSYCWLYPGIRPCDSMPPSAFTFTAARLPPGRSTRPPSRRARRHIPPQHANSGLAQAILPRRTGLRRKVVTPPARSHTMRSDRHAKTRVGPRKRSAGLRPLLTRSVKCHAKSSSRKTNELAQAAGLKRNTKGAHTKAQRHKEEKTQTGTPREPISKTSAKPNAAGPQCWARISGTQWVAGPRNDRRSPRCARHRDRADKNSN